MAIGKLIVAGGSGFIGSPLVRKLLESGYDLVLLTRNPSGVRLRHPKLKVCRWDGKSLGEWVSEVESARAIINLSGAGIADERWTAERKREILNSRIYPLQALVQAAIRSANPPKTLITASAVGFYGDLPPDRVVTEQQPHGHGFLSDVCVQWEKAAQNAASFGIRVVMLRFGVVIASDGGALPKFFKPFRMYAGGPLGSGRQIVPWVHRDDALGAVLHALETHDLSGPVNVTAPHPVSMKEFCGEIGKMLGRPSWLPVPAFVLKSMLGEMSEVVLGGQRCVPRKLMDSGFKFKHAELGPALKSLTQNGAVR